MKEHRPILLGRHALITLFLLTLILMASAMSFALASEADDYWYDGEVYEFDFENNDYDFEVILDDPIYFMFDDEDLYDPYYEDENGAVTDAYQDTGEIEQMPSPTEEVVEEPAETSAPLPDEPDAPRLGTPKPPKKEPMLYDIPEDVLAADEKFAMLMEEATKYIGYPYVWGGHRPETSFDCSGFVSYVFTFSGVYKTGGRGATGLYSICQPVGADEARPGDLVFFQGTMGKNVDGITHVGIYVGNQMMLHCGSPIGYADLTEDFWIKHFYGYGRLPYEVQ